MSKRPKHQNTKTPKHQNTKTPKHQNIKAREIGLLKLAEERGALRGQVEQACEGLQAQHRAEVAALKRAFEVSSTAAATQLSRAQDSVHIQKQVGGYRVRTGQFFLRVHFVRVVRFVRRGSSSWLAGGCRCSAAAAATAAAATTAAAAAAATTAAASSSSSSSSAAATHASTHTHVHTFARAHARVRTQRWKKSHTYTHTHHTPHTTGAT